MTKVERRKERLFSHYAMLERLGSWLGMKAPNGKKLSLALWKLEQEAHKGAEDYCNGIRFNDDEDAWDTFSSDIERRVNALFGAEVPGLFLNGDCRGYALKINDECLRTVYPDSIGIQRDWGGYGLLSPDINGN